jgi:hypothetical protein
VQGGTLVAAGTIAGGAGGTGGDVKTAQGDAVQFGASVGTEAGTLIIDPQAVFRGNIVADTSVDDMLVFAGTAAGTLSGFGTSVTGFDGFSVDAHADWTVSGSISGTGAIDIGEHASLALDGTVTIASISLSRGDSITLGSPAEVTSSFAGFDAGDSIVLDGVSATKLSYAGGTLTLYNAAGATVDELKFLGSYKQSDFQLKADGTATEVAYAGGNAETTPLLAGDFLSYGLLQDLQPGHASSANGGGVEPPLHPALAESVALPNHAMPDPLGSWAHMAIPGSWS